MCSVFWEYSYVVWQVDTSVLEEPSASAFKVLHEEGGNKLCPKRQQHILTRFRVQEEICLNLSELKTCKMAMFQRKITPLNKREAFKRMNF